MSESEVDELTVGRPVFDRATLGSALGPQRRRVYSRHSDGGAGDILEDDGNRDASPVAGELRRGIEWGGLRFPLPDGLCEAKQLRDDGR
jgi:hypothetical protein